MFVFFLAVVSRMGHTFAAKLPIVILLRNSVLTKVNVMLCVCVCAMKLILKLKNKNWPVIYHYIGGRTHDLPTYHSEVVSTD